MKREETAVIIGAGPAGLTAATELLTRTKIRPIVIEVSGQIGGISQTVNYKGNRMDIGGHRFFSKNERVTRWWEELMPMQGQPALDDILLNKNKPLQDGGPDPDAYARAREPHIFSASLLRLPYFGEMGDLCRHGAEEHLPCRGGVHESRSEQTAGDFA